MESASRAGIWRPMIRYALPALVLITGILISPNAIPVLPVDSFIQYQRTLTRLTGLKAPKTETSALRYLPQLYADMFGWEEMTKAVAEVYHDLPPNERSRTAIYASNYGEAAAIDFFGPRYGLPKATSGHMSYYLWGPPPPDFDVMIAINGIKEGYQRAFIRVQLADKFGTEYSMPYEHGPIYLCRDPMFDNNRLWPLTRRYR